MRGHFETPGEHFLLKAVPHPNGCWVWMGVLSPDGYPRFTHRRKYYSAHRWSYETFTGIALGDRHAHHTCENPRCVNPAHIEPKSPSEHTDMHVGRRNREKTHCKRGHAFTPENTYISKGSRWCRTCLREYKREWERCRKI